MPAWPPTTATGEKVEFEFVGNVEEEEEVGEVDDDDEDEQPAPDAYVAAANEPRPAVRARSVVADSRTRKTIQGRGWLLLGGGDDVAGCFDKTQKAII